MEVFSVRIALYVVKLWLKLIGMDLLIKMWIVYKVILPKKFTKPLPYETYMVSSLLLLLLQIFLYIIMLFDNANDKITANYVELTKLPINAILGALHVPKKFG